MELFANTIKSEEKAIFKFRSLFQKYGYTQYKMSKFEEYDLYMKNKDFLVSGEIITFTDKTGKLLALKPDVTLSIIKNSQDVPGFIQKVYYNENVYRVSKGSNTFKEIMQTGLECIGDIGIYEICETVMLAAKSLETVSKDYVLDISFIDILEELLNGLLIPREVKGEITACIGQKNISDIEKICELHGIDGKQRQCLLDIVSLYGNIDDVILKLKSVCITEEMKAAYETFKEICILLKEMGLKDRINIDFSIVNDMKYYNGIVFKGYINGIPESVLSGGQYDKMMKSMGRRSGAIGFAVYMDLLKRLDKTEKYDVDTVLIYKDSTAPSKLIKKVDELSQSGSVLAVKAVPQNIKYKEICEIN